MKAMTKLWAVVWIGMAGAIAAAAAPPTFNRDIAPILYKNCATCHRPGEVAPFSLLTYQDAAKRAKQIATVTQSRFMPPWKAEPGYGSFQNERRLTDEQIAMLRDWAANGAPEGDARGRTPTHASGVRGRMAGGSAGPGVHAARKVFAGGGWAGSVPLLRDPHESGSRRVREGVRIPAGQPARGASRHRVQRSQRGRRANWLATEAAIRVSAGRASRPTGLVGGWAPGGSPIAAAKGMDVDRRQGNRPGVADPLPSFGQAGAGSILAGHDLRRSSDDRARAGSGQFAARSTFPRGNRITW